ncbi:hypothetical protein EVG20_g8710 [Dentipellis fragilis]|uniref:Glutamine amidotransferase domain-containing protein n=1 Tax=Dentipellis fragilis TaxID=205917 RepID=A0A4Y9Y6E5_9AGAM|nr:hypothetical protein EVG20_g8710 [Dentipellis fragilis]
MGLFLLDYGAGNVQSLANSLEKLGHEFKWISSPEDFDVATSLVFPGVGAFQTAVEGLRSRGLLEPLRKYIASGKPYFGICIGMQVLFQSSSEGDVAGLGIIPTSIGLFSNEDKSVPHMGWNSVELLDSEHKSNEGIDQSAHYYFVHSYRAAYDPEHNPEAAQWVHSVAQYGQEVFVSSVRKGNVFGCQFHPEKSGPAGLRLLNAWLSEPESQREHAPATPRISHPPKPKDGLTKRIIACMDVRSNDQGDLVVTKGDQYDVREKPSSSAPTANAVETAGAVRNLGKPVALASRYYAAGRRRARAAQHHLLPALATARPADARGRACGGAHDLRAPYHRRRHPRHGRPRWHAAQRARGRRGVLPRGRRQGQHRKRGGVRGGAHARRGRARRRDERD